MIILLVIIVGLAFGWKWALAVLLVWLALEAWSAR